MTYRSTIARQPAALADTHAAIVAQLAAADLAAFDRPVIGLTGIGASLAAARIGAAEFQRLGRRAIACFPDELVAGRGLVDTVIGLSHRGRSVETVKAFADNPQAACLALTNDASSPLALAAKLHLRLDNGTDATPSATGYTSSLLAVGMVAEAMTGRHETDWAGLVAQVGTVLAGAAATMERLASQFAGCRAMDCVASAAAFGSADEAALLVREAARIPAAGFETRDYLHGPMEAMDGTTGVIVIGSGREVKLATDLDAIGVPTLLVTAAPEAANGNRLTVLHVPPQASVAAQAVLDILAPQLLAATLSDALGLTDVKFRYRQSDTKIA